MEKENKKRVMMLTIIAVSFLLVLVIGASFAYFQVVSSNTAITNITAVTPKIKGIVFRGLTSELYLNPTATELASDSENKNLYATKEDVDAEVKEQNHIYGEFVTEGVDNYYCTANIEIKLKDNIENNLKDVIQDKELYATFKAEGENGVISGLDEIVDIGSNKEYSKVIGIVLRGTSDIKIKGDVYLVNKDIEQNHLINKSLEADININIIDCEEYVEPKVNSFILAGTNEEPFTLTNGYSHKKGITYTLSWNEEKIKVKEYCVSEEEECSNYSEVNEGTIITNSYELIDEERTHTLYATLKDEAGTIIKTSSEIILDKTNPTNVSISNEEVEETSIKVTINGDDNLGIKKKQCRISTNETWIDAEENICTIDSDLEAGQTYNVIVRVTDLSGRYTEINKDIKTLSAYKCTIGEKVEDTIKGTSTGGYICTVKANDQNWKTTESYYTCSRTSSHYSSESAAASACSVLKDGSCSPAPSDSSKYLCSFFGNAKYSSESFCEQVCHKETLVGSVNSYTSTSYYCPDGWTEYSGTTDNEDYTCYQGATK